jgi:hypothetical protein
LIKLQVRFEELGWSDDAIFREIVGGGDEDFECAACTLVGLTLPSWSAFRVADDRIELA